MVRSRSGLAVVLVLSLMLVPGCGTAEGDTPVSGPPTADTGFELAGIWRDTDLVGTNSCDLPQPAPGTSRVTEGIVLTQTDDMITLTAPVNILGTQTVASGTLSDDGSMTLTGTDSGTTTTLEYQALSDSEITGTSQVDTGTCVFHFTNTLVRTADPE